MSAGYSSKIKHEVNIKTRNKLNSLIVAYNHLSRISNQIDTKEIHQLKEHIKENFPKRKYKTFFDFERKLIGYKGIEPCDVSKYKISDVRYPIEVEKNSYRKMIGEENFDNFKQWDNSKVSQKMKNLFLSWKEKQSKIITQDNNNNNNENVVTPKQIAVCSQSASITTGEIKNVDTLLTKILLPKEDKEKENCE